MVQDGDFFSAEIENSGLIARWPGCWHPTELRVNHFAACMLPSNRDFVTSVVLRGTKRCRIRCYTYSNIVDFPSVVEEARNLARYPQECWLPFIAVQQQVDTPITSAIGGLQGTFYIPPILILSFILYVFTSLGGSRS